MTAADAVRIAVVAVGLLIGYGVGRYLWQRHATVLTPWIVIAIVAITGLITSRLFAALGDEAIWQAIVFPLLVGSGAGLSVTPARPPLRSPWWQLWKV